jgi:hypothetical protein
LYPFALALTGTALWLATQHRYGTNKTPLGFRLLPIKHRSKAAAGTRTFCHKGDRLTINEYTCLWL